MQNAGNSRFFKTSLVFPVSVLLALVTSGCANVDTCEEMEAYEYAQSGQRIEAPEGLDDLSANNELVIPKASPRPPRDRSAGCIDRPPALRTN